LPGSYNFEFYGPLHIVKKYTSPDLPPTPRDLTSGAEAIAEFAVREGRMINSVFSVDVGNNAVKPPFITSLQIIYKLAGFPFGKVWLSTIFVSERTGEQRPFEPGPIFQTPGRYQCRTYFRRKWR
jgi:hypothetical protein